jgi:hypothetical protein
MKEGLKDRGDSENEVCNDEDDEDKYSDEGGSSPVALPNGK